MTTNSRQLLPNCALMCTAPQHHDGLSETLLERQEMSKFSPNSVRSQNIFVNQNQITHPDFHLDVNVLLFLPVMWPCATEKHCLACIYCMWRFSFLPKTSWKTWVKPLPVGMFLSATFEGQTSFSHIFGTIQLIMFVFEILPSDTDGPSLALVCMI